MSGLKALAARARGLEIVTAPSVPLDDAGEPCGRCPACQGGMFHREPERPWRCSACVPPILPDCASKLAGWAFCGVPG
jgi:hypothetical protein